MKQNDESIFYFPTSIPNDLENFVVFYRNKFPAITPQFYQLAKNYFKKPKEFKEFIYTEQKELYRGFYKIKQEYDKQKNKTEEYIVKTDQRLHKLFCFKFWIVNYGFCDGPLHEFYVRQVKHYAELAADWDDLEEKQNSIEEFERTLLQGDYADLYLQSAFLGIKIHDTLLKSKQFSSELKKIQECIHEKNDEKAYPTMDRMITTIKRKNTADEKILFNLLEDSFDIAAVRGDNLAIHNVILHALEYREQSIELKERHDTMIKRIKTILKAAKKRLTPQEHEDLEVSYKMANLFKEAKDVFGSIDSVLLPFWFGILEELAVKINIPESAPQFGHAGMFYRHIWWLPPELKAKVYTPDPTPYSYDTL